MRCPRCARKLAAGATCPADGASAVIEGAETAPEEIAAPVLAGWEIGERIAAGGQGAVYAARREGAGFGCVIKVAHHASASLEAEAAAMRALGAAGEVTSAAPAPGAAGERASATGERHGRGPIVAAYVEHGVLADRRPYLVMERVEGETLGGVLERAAAALPVEEVLAWGREIAGALAALHEKGWVHRDLKPDNIVREADGRVRLLDLGLAVRAEERTAGGNVAGTLHYMAPEQLRGAVVDARADLYALGAVLFEMAAMRPPFVGDRAAIELGQLAFRAPRLSTLRAVPRALEALIGACLAKAPDDRPESAAAVRDALATIDPAAEVVSSAVAAAAAARTLVALVDVDGAPAGFQVDAEVKRRGGLIAKQVGGRYVLGFVPDECAAPLPAAIALARAVVAARGRATVHVAEVVVRRSRGRTALYGAAIERPAAWAAPPGAPLVLTAAAARELDEHEVVASTIPGFLALRAEGDAAPLSGGTGERALERTERPALLGRDELLQAARAAARATLDGGPPALWIALGGPGSGKTRIADAVAVAVADEVSDAAVIRLDGRRTFGSGGAATASLLDRLAALAAGAAEDAAETAERAPDGPERAERSDGESRGDGQNPSTRPAASLGAIGGVSQTAAASLGAIGGPPLTVTVRAAIDGALAMGPLAIVIDDAQWIDDALLDALATAVRTGQGMLWVAVVAADSVTATRPAWMDGTRVTSVTIGALEDEDAGTLLRRLLAPARRVPEPLIKRLVARTGNVPGMIAALARELARAGLVRKHPGSEVWYLAADELDVVPPAPGVHWFVTRRIAALGPGLPELARVCALLGPRFGLAEVDAAASVAVAGVAIDPQIGADALCAAGLLRREGQLSFASEAEQEALASSLPEAARVEVHRAVLAELRRAGDRARDERAAAGTDDRAAAVAYHAARAGETELALDQLEALAAASRARLAHLETARWLTQALELAGEKPSARRRRLLTERGRARRMLTQYEQAATDLREARALAEAEGDTPAIVDILVIETACADFTEQLGEAVRAIERALELARGRDGQGSELPASIRARLCNWLGVVRARQERLSEARTELEQAIELAGQTGDHDTAIGSMLMLGGVMRRLGLVDDGRAVLDRVIELCERTGDHFHLAAAHFNRINVWRRLGEPARAEADAERAIAIANRMGIDQLELWGWYNLSELRWWTGTLDGALAASEASHRIGVERFRARPPVIGALWYALLLGAAGEIDAARRVLDEVRADEVGHNPWLALVRDVAALVCAGELGAAWEPLVARAARPGAEEDAVMVHWARARAAARAGDATLAEQAKAAASAAAAALGRAAPA